MSKARLAGALLRGAGVFSGMVVAAGIGVACRVAGYEPHARSLRRAAALRRVALGGPGTTPPERDGAAEALSDMFRRGIVDPAELDVYVGAADATGTAATLLKAARDSRSRRGKGDYDDARSRAEDALEAFACHLAVRRPSRGGWRDVL